MWKADSSTCGLAPIKGAATDLPVPLITHHPSLITRYRDAFACALLCALTAIFAWPVAALGYLPSSSDFILQYYPNLAFLARNLRAGILPLWNPTLFAGTPYLADPQSQLLYFPNWPFLVLLGTTDASRAIVLAHLALAAVSAYLYLRHLRLSAVPSMLGAIVYGLGPYAIAQVAWLPMLISLAWMPLVLLLFEQALERRSLSKTALCGAVLALQFFNGWPHGSYITGFALVAMFLWEIVTEVSSARSLRPAVSLSALAGVAAAAFLGFAAPVILPFLEFWGQSNYIAERGVEAAASEGNVTILALLGVGGSEGHGAYVGILGLLLALLGVLHGRDNKRWVYLALGAFALLVAFGANTPIYGLLYRWVPGFRTFHVPGRFAVLFVLSASILAAMGADALARLSGRKLALTGIAASLVLAIPGAYALSRMLGPDAPTRLAANLLHPEIGPYLNAAMASHLVVAFLVALLFVLALATNRLSGGAVILALLLVAGDILFFQGKDANYFSAPPLPLRAASPVPAIEQLAGERGFRVAGFQQTGVNDFMSDFPFNVNTALVPPNFSLLYDVEDLQGYLPLRLRSYADYLAAVNGGADDYHWALLRNFQSPLLDLLNLRYVMIRDNEDRLSNITVAVNPPLRPGQHAVVHLDPIQASAIQVNSYLGSSTEIENGRVVARVNVQDASGAIQSFDIRAGYETAEWGYDRPDVKTVVKHDRAPIAETRNLPASTHIYRGDFNLPAPLTISQISVEQMVPSVSVSVSEIIVVPAHPLERYEKVGELDGAMLYRNQMALPRVLMVPGSEQAADADEALRKIQAVGFDPRKTVILQGRDAPALQPSSSGSIGEAAILSRNTNGVSISVNAASSGFLLLNELSYPGWNAYLDGRQVKVWRANFLFRAIEVPPGQHDVEFRFEPDSLKLGLALSASTLALLLVATAILRRKFRKKEITVP